MEAQEEWRPVVGYEEFYEVSDMGRVRSLPRKGRKGCIRKPTPAKIGGYLQVCLCKNSEQETCKVHQLVMEAFVGRCPEGCEVDHFDWNPSNNRLSNLSYQPKEVNRARRSPEWLVKMKKLAQDTEWQKNHTEAMQKLSQDPEWRKNQSEATRKANSKPVDQLTLGGQLIKTWPSATDAARELGIGRGHISKCCNGKRKSTGGYIWRYAENKEAS